MNNQDAKTNALRQDWPVLLLLAASFIGGLLAYPRLQGPVIVHWNVYGEPDGFISPLIAVLGFPLGTLALYLMLLWMPRLDPRRANYERFSPTMRVMRWTLLVMFIALQWMGMSPALGLPADPGRLTRLLISALFVLIGNVLGQVRPTYFVGIRTPWTLADDGVWRRTHRLGARLWVAAGLVGILSVFLPKAVGNAVFATALTIGALVPVVYSYVDYRRTRSNPR